MFNFLRQNAQGQLATHLHELFKLNMALSAADLPFYHLGGAHFNTEYRLYPPPRYVGMWRPPFVRLAEVYLIYKVGTPEQKDIVFEVGSGDLLVSGPAGE
jgi:hypothetical protein